MTCNFKKAGKGRPSKDLVCIVAGCGKPYSAHSPSAKTIKARAKKAGITKPEGEQSPDHTAGTAEVTPTPGPIAPSSVESPPAASTTSGSEVVAELAPALADGTKVGDW